jgi:hypothetical protein
MAISFWRDSDWADLGNERIGSLGYVPAVRFDCPDATTRTAGNTNPCGVINGTPHGFLFDTKNFLKGVSRIRSGSDTSRLGPSNAEIGLHFPKAKCELQQFTRADIRRIQADPLRNGAHNWRT